MYQTRVVGSIMIWNSFVNQIVLLPILEDWKKPVQSICHEQHLCKKIQAHIKGFEKRIFYGQADRKR